MGTNSREPMLHTGRQNFVTGLAGRPLLEQIVFGPLAGLSDGGRFAPCSFVFEQSFEHADGGMERRAPAFGCFAVPAAIFELRGQELIGQCVVRFCEIRADGEDSAIDAGLRFAVTERPVVERLKHERPLREAMQRSSKRTAMIVSRASNSTLNRHLRPT